jgi:hypothetical protein
MTYKLARKQWKRTQQQVLESKKPFGLDLTPLQSPPIEEKKIIEIAMKFEFQIDSIILNLFTGKLSIHL